MDRAVRAVPAIPGSRRGRTLILCAAITVLMLAIFIGGRLIGEDAVAADFGRQNLAPSLRHPFGTDWLGRDMFLRTVKGLSISIAIGTAASLVSAAVALVVGVAAATGTKALDAFLTWCIDLVMGVPHLVLLILISFACGRGMTGLLVGIAATHWTSLARLIRGEVLSIRSQPYILASKKLGRSRLWVLTRHILPHMVPQLLTGTILLFPHAILHESSLSFLGFGLPPEQPAIGIILAESMKHLSSGMWWLAVFPGLTLVLVVVLIDKLGESLRTLLDPYSAQQ